jgi:hypothetical protein
MQKEGPSTMPEAQLADPHFALKKSRSLVFEWAHTAGRYTVSKPQGTWYVSNNCTWIILMVYYIQSPIPQDLQLNTDECADECVNDADMTLVDITPGTKSESK